MCLSGLSAQSTRALVRILSPAGHLAGENGATPIAADASEADEPAHFFRRAAI
jgi:hypothetical protein